MQESEVSARLAALPHPAMPADVAADIEARLAQEHKVVPLTPRHRSRLNWLVAAAVALAFATLIGIGTSGGSSTPVAGPPIVRAGAVFEPTGFASQLQQRMGGGTATKEKTNTFADTTAGITACATAVKAYGRVIFLDAGTYDRQRAVVLVTAYPAQTDYEEVWVVSPDCGFGDSSVYRHMVYDVDGSTRSSI